MPASAFTLAASTAMGQVVESAARTEKLQEGGEVTNPNDAQPIENLNFDFDTNQGVLAIAFEFTHDIDANGNNVITIVDPFEDAV